MKLLKSELIPYCITNPMARISQDAKSKLGDKLTPGIEELINQACRNGKTCSQWTEIYAQSINFKIKGKLGRFEMSVKDSKEIDGFLITNNNRYRTSIRSLTLNGIKFQLSKYIGQGRNCNNNDLKHSLSLCDFYIVCDIKKTNFWTYWLIDNQTLLDAVNAGHLKPAGYDRFNFFEFLDRYNYKLPAEVSSLLL